MIRPRHARRLPSQLRCEQLEDRSVPATFTVTNTLDDGSPGSLRWAIGQVNADTDPTSSIDFSIPGAGVQTISPTTVLPTITHPVVIDGYTQPGSSANSLKIGDNAVWLISLDGSLLGGFPTGLELSGGSSTVRGLAISRFADDIVLSASGNNLIAGNELTDCAVGVYDNSTGNDMLGGIAASDRNLIGVPTNRNRGAGIVIAGNGNQVEGNYVGVDATGTRATHGTPVLATLVAGVEVAGSFNLIGGTTPGTGNTISGSFADVWLGVAGRGLPELEAHNVVQGNFLGTDATGLHALISDAGPGYDGVYMDSDANSNLIGGSAPGAGNVISGHSHAGIESYDRGHETVLGNFIGTDITGTQPIPNGFGVDNPHPGDIVGGSRPGEGNVIAFNVQAGVRLLYNSGVRVEGNAIHDNGGAGVDVWDNAITSAQIVGNAIYANAGPGVWVHGQPLDLEWEQLDGQLHIPTGIAIQRNSIHDNAGLGIDLGALPVDQDGNLVSNFDDWWDDIPDGLPQNGSPVGINNGQTFPILSSAWAGPNLGVSGTFDSTPNTNFTIDLYSNSIADPSGYGEGETYLGEVTITADGSGHADLNLTLPFTVPVGQWLSVTATSPTGDTSEFSADVPVQTFAQYLQATLPQSSTASNSLTILAGPSADPETVIQAVNGLTNVTQPVTITLDLGGGTWTADTAIDPPANVTLVIQNGTLIGGSPALTVTGGNVIGQSLTLSNATNAPTILVTGGHLTLRNDVIQESTGYDQVAILVTGGTADLGTVTDPGGSTINVNGAGTLAVNDTATAVFSVGNVWELNGTIVDGPVAIKAAPTVTVTGGTFIYDGQPHSATGAVKGVNGEKIGTPIFTYSYINDAGTVVTLSGPPTEPGYYSVVASFAGNDNHSSASANTTIAIVFDAHTLTDLSRAFHAGRTIPIKIALTDANGNNLSFSGIDLTALRLERINADGSTTEVSLQDAGGSNPNNLFRYDATLGGYIFNLSTKDLGAGTYEFYWMAEGDPTEHSLCFWLI